MTGKRKRNPSQERYDMKRPTITIRAKSAEQKEEIYQLAEEMGKTVPQMTLEALEIYIKDNREYGKRKYDEGWDDGKEEFEITIPCFKCDGPMLLRPGSKMHKSAIDLLQDRGWHHGECPKKK